MYSLSLLFSSLLFASGIHAFADNWSFGCFPETVQRSDPLLSPGVASGHVHAVVGGNAFSRNMNDPDSAKDSTATSCDIPSDRSEYWTPQLYHIEKDGTFTIVPMAGTGLYYLNRACNYSTPNCDTYSVPVRAFPEGFRMIAGDSTRRTYNATDVAQQAISLYCDGVTYHGQFPPATCKQMRAQVTFPSCWDGVNVTSANFQSHVAYPSNYDGGNCPGSHPVAIIQLFSEWTYNFYDFANGKFLYSDTNFVFANGDTTGNGFHGDFVNGWQNLTILQNSFQNCQGSTPETCEVRGYELPPGTTPQQATQPLIHPAIYEEDIGLKGNAIPKLPGNNPVYKPA